MLVILADSSYFYPINLISNSKQMKNRLYTYLAGWIFLWLPTLLLAQAIDGPTALFLMHSSGNHVAKDAQGGAVLEAADAPSPQKLTFIPDGNGYYALQSAERIVALMADMANKWPYMPPLPKWTANRYWTSSELPP